jgi:hypothetical protein
MAEAGTVVGTVARSKVANRSSLGSTAVEVADCGKNRVTGDSFMPSARHIPFLGASRAVDSARPSPQTLYHCRKSAAGIVVGTEYAVDCTVVPYTDVTEHVLAVLATQVVGRDSVNMAVVTAHETTTPEYSRSRT